MKAKGGFCLPFSEVTLIILKTKVYQSLPVVILMSTNLAEYRHKKVVLIVCGFFPKHDSYSFSALVFDIRNPSDMKDYNRHEALITDIADSCG